MPGRLRRLRDQYGRRLGEGGQTAPVQMESVQRDELTGDIGFIDEDGYV